MPATITGLGQQVGDGDFFWSNGVPWRERAVAIGMPTGEHAPTRGRTRRMPRIKMIQPQPRPRHLIHHRRLEMRMAVIARLRPAMVRAHQQDDIRPICRTNRCSTQG